jgi:hypothetical protein
LQPTDVPVCLISSLAHEARPGETTMDAHRYLGLDLYEWSATIAGSVLIVLVAWWM